MKHTPGPWQIIEGSVYAAEEHRRDAPYKNDEGEIVEYRTGLIALVYGFRPEGIEDVDYQQDKNVQLIAAAPKMAEMLLSMWQHVSHGGPTRSEVEDLLREAGVL